MLQMGDTCLVPVDDLKVAEASILSTQTRASATKWKTLHRSEGHIESGNSPYKSPGME